MTLRKLKRAVIFTAFFLISCASEQTRLNRALDIATEHDFAAEIIAGNFPMQIFYRNQFSSHAVIYLEGDGLVINKYGEVALNPTPTDPVALKLASVDHRPWSKIVINRPFHYLKMDPSLRRDGFPLKWESKYWTMARYAPEIIQAIFEVIKTCQLRFKFKTLEIVAYSGGAAVALLLAPHLDNLTRMVSFAGNLDHVSWTKYHDTQPLFESLDPLQNKAAIGKVPQIHFIGTSDANTTIDLAHGYSQKVNSSKITIVPVPGFSHDSNWSKIWAANLASAN